MREILFRAKSVTTGGWFFVNIIHGVDAKKYMGLIWEDYQIIPETIGQYTGLKDSNGTKIFEGDIVTAKFKSNGARFNFEIRYNFKKGIYEFHNRCIGVLFDHIRSLRVIGNIHDNPELLEVNAE